MHMTSRLRKFTLTAHVTSSVGWLGSVAAFLVVAVVAVIDSADHRARAASIIMTVIGWYVIVPLSAAALLSGVVQSIGTPWGLFRHYWVIAKLIITVAASVLLVLHMRVVESIALAASDSGLPSSHLHGPKMQVIADAGAALGSDLPRGSGACDCGGGDPPPCRRRHALALTARTR